MRRKLDLFLLALMVNSVIVKMAHWDAKVY